MKSQLYVHEWLAVAALAIFCTLVAIATFVLEDFTPPPPEQSDTIAVDIEGSVRFPGAYQLPKNAVMQELLALAEPLPEASLKGLRRKSKLHDGQVVQIKEKTLITLQVDGAVKRPGPLQVREGTRLVDLLSLVAFTPDANIDALKKKRRLKDGERVIVPRMR